MTNCIVCGRSYSDDITDCLDGPHQLHSEECKSRGQQYPCDCDIIACDIHCPECASIDIDDDIEDVLRVAEDAIHDIANRYFNSSVRPWLDANGGLGCYYANDGRGPWGIFSKDGHMFKPPYWMESALLKRVIGRELYGFMPIYRPWEGSVNK